MTNSRTIWYNQTLCDSKLTITVVNCIFNQLFIKLIYYLLSIQLPSISCNQLSFICAMYYVLCQINKNLTCLSQHNVNIVCLYCHDSQMPACVCLCSFSVWPYLLVYCFVRHILLLMNIFCFNNWVPLHLHSKFDLRC
jgi:hypothetical protein